MDSIKALAAVIGGAVLVWWFSRRGTSQTLDVPEIVFRDEDVMKAYEPKTPDAWSKLKEWADAIMRFEGVNPNDGKLTLAERKNNPGNLRDPKTGQYREFATFDEGRRALEADLAAKVRKYPTWTLAQIMARYAPASDNNDPVAYANFVAKRLGVAVTDTLKQIFG